MRPRAQSSLLWGTVAALVFLVLAQGYELLFASGIGLLTKFGIAVVAFVCATGASYVFDSWLERSERS
ncbi:MAG TPA: hypothetical protein VFJ06_04355 [Halococcus sp.]|nr:hypothetical protein [Halococcus sp.]